MALYRFKVTFEDYDDVTREIDVKSNQTFEDLHRGIHKSTGYDVERPSSFFVSNDQWTKGEEFTYLPNQKRQDRGITLMEKAKLSSQIDDPHQKFYYVYNFDRPYDFHVELMKIIMDEDPKLTYPHIVKSVGEAPKIASAIASTAAAATSTATSDEFDFLNEMEFNPEDAEDFSEVDEHGESTSGRDEDEHDEDNDDEMDEFADNEHMDDEESGYGRGGGRNDDY